MDAAPSMVQRSGDSLIVYSPVSGNQIFKTNNNNSNENNNKSDDNNICSDNIKTSIIKLENNNNNNNNNNNFNTINNNNNNLDDDENLRKSSEKDEGLPQCKIKRNYSCSNCTFFTQNPRHYLIHLRDKHGEKIVINECKLCLYASRHYQKLVRHMKMVHGSTEGLDESSSGRKRQSNLNKLNNNNNNSSSSNHNNNNNNNSSNNNGGTNKKRKLISINESLTQQISNILNSNQLPPPSSTTSSTTSPIFNALLQSQLNDSGLIIGSIQHQQAAVNAAASLILEQQHNQQQQQQQQQHHHQLLQKSNDYVNNISIANNNNNNNTGNIQTIDKKLLKCSICDYTTVDRVQLIDHEKNDHIKTKFFRCIKCNYVTHIKARYSKHVKYHSMPMIKCIMCDFRTPYKWNLDRHMKNHGGTGPFKCSACNFTADIKQSLTVHEMNHHVPPVGHITNLVKRRNKVGGTDLNDELVAIGDGNNNNQHNASSNAGGDRHEIWPYIPLFLNPDEMNPDLHNNDVSDLTTSISDGGGDMAGDQISMNKITPPLISPPNLLKTGSISESDNQQINRKAKRPIPNLIPINVNLNNLSNNSGSTSTNNVLNLSMKKEPNSSDDPMTITNHFMDEMQNFHKQPPNLEEITKALQNSLKQFGLLLNEGQILPPNAQSTSQQHNIQTPISCNSSESDRNSPASVISHGSSSLNHNTSTNSKIGSKKINFYDKLKENSLSGLSDTDKLICRCGHVSKCLSESILHKKSCECRFDDLSTSSLNLPHASNINSSTRCQYCRHRCKTSTDLMIHLQTCSEVHLDSIESSSDITTNGGCGRDSKHDDEFDDDEDDDDLIMGNHHHPNNDDDDDENDSMDEALIDNPNEPHPMENVVFVWNKIPDNKTDSDDVVSDGGGGGIGVGRGDGSDVKKEICDDELSSDGKNETRKTSGQDHQRGDEPNQYYAIETAPGYGEVTKEIKTLGELTNYSLKRVFKCPQCPFWASTASRFHVHIVGHLNQKPFECSLCSYRSNWRWDITKHIRLKTIRDPMHESAKVLMNDETGRRNYTKYNKYITLMKVTAENNETKFLKSGEMINLSHHNTSQEDLFDKSSGNVTPNYSHIVSSPSTSSSPVSNNNNAASNLMINLSSPEISIDNGDSMKIKMEISANDKKKTNFKCKKCNFRHHSRDVVLAHVKQHYRDAGISIDDTNADDTVTIASQTSISPPIISQDINPLSLLTPKILLTTPTTPVVDKQQQLVDLLPKDDLLLHHQQQQQQQQQQHYNHQQQQIISKIQLENPIINSQLTSNMLQPQLPSQTSPQLLPTSTTITTTSTTLPSPQQSLVQASVNNNVQTSSQSNNNNNNNLNNNNNSNSNSNNGDMDETNSGVSSVSGWRCPAPYRCGHCHQVSNWKHVIQRHCRLKHHGDIRIELFDKISLKNNKNATPNYQPLNVYNSHHKNNNNSAVSHITSAPTQMKSFNAATTSSIYLAAQQLEQQFQQKIQSSASTSSGGGVGSSSSCSSTPNIDKNEQSDNNNMTRVHDKSNPNNITGDHSQIINDDDDDDELEEIFDDYNTDMILIEREKNLNSLTNHKKYKCDQCPYVTGTKYQFMYHETFHKPHTKMLTNYQCNYCSYNVTRKHLLNQHLRIHEGNDTTTNCNNNNTNSIMMMNDDHNNMDDDYELMYCQSCPGRYLNENDFLLHTKMHLKKFPYQCFLCTYTTKTMVNLNKHLYVHTNNYNLKTKEIEKKFIKINQNYPKPKIICINTSKNIYSSTNTSNTNSDSDNNNNNNNLYWIVITKSFINNLNNDKNNLINLDLDDMIKSNKVPISPHQPQQPQQQQQLQMINNNFSLPTTKQSNHLFNKNNNNNNNNSNSSNSLLIGHIINNNSSNSNIEKCPYCPYTTNKKEIIKNHLHFHKIISGIERNLKCKHCDFSINDLKLFTDHRNLHFSLIQNLFNGGNNKNSNVAFYTSFTDLEINFIKNINQTMDNILDPVSTTTSIQQQQQTQLVYKENIKIENNHNNDDGDEDDDNDSNNSNNSDDSDDNHEKIILNINSSDIQEN